MPEDVEPKDNVRMMECARVARQPWAPDADAWAQLAEADARHGGGEGWAEFRPCVFAGIADVQVYTRTAAAAGVPDWHGRKLPKYVLKATWRARAAALSVMATMAENDVLARAREAAGIPEGQPWTPPPEVEVRMKRVRASMLAADRNGRYVEPDELDPPPKQPHLRLVD